MVSAAAAILFGADPRLQPGQVSALLEQTAHRVADPRHQAGAGVLDIDAALERVRRGLIPHADEGEPNDRAAEAMPLRHPGVIRATLDWSDDPADVYRLKLRAGAALKASSHGTFDGTISVSVVGHERPLASVSIGRILRYRARRSGTYLLRLTPQVRGRGGYVLNCRSAVSRPARADGSA